MTEPHDASGPFSDEELGKAFAVITPRTAWRILARNEARALFDLVREAEDTQELKARQLSEAKLIRQGIWRALASASFSPSHGWKCSRIGGQVRASRPRGVNCIMRVNVYFSFRACLSLGVAVLALLHAFAPGFFDLSGPAQKKGTVAPDAIELWEVVAVGALGGLIAAVFTISKLGGFSGPYRLPAYQALIRVPAGAAVALAAVLLMQSGQIKGLSGQAGLSILAVALLFGYAPDVLLRFMDQKTTSLLSQAQTKNNPARPPLAQPRA